MPIKKKYRNYLNEMASCIVNIKEKEFLIGVMSHYLEREFDLGKVEARTITEEYFSELKK